ncbi:MAG: hypothetical protein WCA49_02375 [Candidatus Sulfotelmatobacter sp.]
MNMHRELRFGFLAVLVTMIASTLVLGATTTTAAVSAAVGDWEGKIDTGNGSLRVIVHISQASDGKLNGSLDSPDQGSTGTAIDSVIYKEPDLHFAIELFGSTFDGKMNYDNSEITGEWKQSGRSLPLVFKRRSK